MPFFWVVMCQAAANQTVIGVRVRWKMVPAVGEIRWPSLISVRPMARGPSKPMFRSLVRVSSSSLSSQRQIPWV